MNDEKVKADVEALREEMNRLENKNAGDTTEDSLIQYIGKLMDENKKQTNLKSL
jgi:methionine salvage enolase-phosphatase E1